MYTTKSWPQLRQIDFLQQIKYQATHSFKDAVEVFHDYRTYGALAIQ